MNHSRHPCPLPIFAESSLNPFRLRQRFHHCTQHPPAWYLAGFHCKPLKDACLVNRNEHLHLPSAASPPRTDARAHHTPGADRMHSARTEVAFYMRFQLSGSTMGEGSRWCQHGGIEERIRTSTSAVIPVIGDAEVWKHCRRYVIPPRACTT